MNYNPIFEKETNNTGLDIKATIGDKVLASRDGVVEFAKWYGGYGMSVKIVHGDGFRTLYGHLKSTTVKDRQSVKKGEIIGFVGSTGMSLDDQLSFSILKDGKYIDPKSLLPTVTSLDVATPKPATNKTNVNPETGFICPFNKSMYKNVNLTASFGNRINPISKLADFHTGVDICLPMDAEILAVYPGKVTIAKWYGGYGNFVEVIMIME